MKPGLVGYSSKLLDQRCCCRGTSNRIEFNHTLMTEWMTNVYRQISLALDANVKVLAAFARNREVTFIRTVEVDAPLQDFRTRWPNEERSDESWQQQHFWGDFKWHWNDFCTCLKDVSECLSFSLDANKDYILWNNRNPQFFAAFERIFLSQRHTLIPWSHCTSLSAATANWMWLLVIYD